MNKKKLKKRIKELSGDNLVLASSNKNLCFTMAELKTHHNNCIRNSSAEISSMSARHDDCIHRMKNELLDLHAIRVDMQIKCKKLQTERDLLGNKLRTACHDEKVNARFMAKVLEG